MSQDPFDFLEDRPSPQKHTAPQDARRRSDFAGPAWVAAIAVLLIGLAGVSWWVYSVFVVERARDDARREADAAAQRMLDDLEHQAEAVRHSNESAAKEKAEQKKVSAIRIDDYRKATELWQSELAALAQMNERLAKIDQSLGEIPDAAFDFERREKVGMKQPADVPQSVVDAAKLLPGLREERQHLVDAIAGQEIGVDQAEKKRNAILLQRSQ
jgi:DNA-binding transcriptional regulator YiaG